MSRTLLNLLKLGVSLAIIVWLVYSTERNDPQTFQRMLQDPKQWDFLALAGIAVLSAVVLTFVRWYLLVRALDLPFRMKDAFRLGFMGFFCNFISLGSVGGDLFKAVFVAREHPTRRPEAVATVVIDRIIGLYALLIVATSAILLTGLWQTDVPEIRLICRAAFWFTGIGLAGIVMLIVPGVTTGRLSEWLANLPKVGDTLGKLIGAIRMYRRRVGAVLLSGLISVGVHSLMALGIYFAARGLPGESPGLEAHFVLVPMALLTGALPLPANGLGAFEAAVEFLYRHLPTIDAVVANGQGLLVALTYRLLTILVALVGAVYYVIAHREAVEVFHEAEEAGGMGRVREGESG